MFWQITGLVVLAASAPWALAADVASAPRLQCSRLEPLPSRLGLGGAFVGVASDALIVAGGSNFPDGPPWDGKAKAWHDRIYVLAEPHGKWVTAETRLQRAVGYGASVSWQGRMIFIGGANSERHFNNVFSLSWQANRAQFDELPALPLPLAMHCGALVGDTIYIAGGMNRPDATEALGVFLALDLSQPAPERQWRQLPTWPGPPRILAMSASRDGAFYLFGGASLISTPDGKTTRQFLADAYCYRPDRGWKQLADLPHTLAAAPSPALTLPSSIAIVGGDEGTLFEKNSELRERHPGFRRDVLNYQIATNAWSSSKLLDLSSPSTTAANSPANLSLPVTTGAAMWQEHYVIASGEIRPATRTRQVLCLEPTVDR